MTARLTKKQEAFALAYIKTGNASEAYRRCYDAKGMKPSTINVKASELLANGKVADRVAALRAPALRAAEISAERTLREVADIGYSDPKAEGSTIKYRDKLTALEMLIKHQGLYERDNRQRAENLALEVVLVKKR